MFAAAPATLAQSPRPDFSGRDPHWIEDTIHHCWAANPDPEPGETITWTGGCEGNLLSGQGVLTWYVNGRLAGRDEGQFKNGQLSGHGRISFADGASFEGEFPGSGVLTLPDGRKVAAQSIREQAGWSIEQSPSNVTQ
jgi:hypothetical protein